MTGLSLCTKEINNILGKFIDCDLKNIEYDTLLEFNYFEEKTIKIINSSYETVYIDVLSILNDHYINLKNKHISIISTSDSRKIPDNEKKKLILRTFNIIVNRLVKRRHISNITLIFATFNEDNDYLKDKNIFLEDIYSKIIRENPGISIMNLNGCLIEKNGEIVVNDNFIYKNKIAFKGEKTYPSICNIRYYFEKAKMFNKKQLIVIFSAFSKDVPKYNYINTLKCIDCNKLFILDDYGIRGSYYVGLDGKFDVETSVMSLITEIMSKYDITFKNVISVGSSKGGSAAIYYGLKYNFGNVIAGAPQYKIGSYLCDLTVKEYGIDIFGDNHINNRLKYDTLIESVIKNNQYTRINLLTGLGDPQYKRVLKEFESVCSVYNIKLERELINIENHSEISKKFPEYLLNKVIQILKGKGCIKNKKILNIFKRI